jgi:hypothetical protein
LMDSFGRVALKIHFGDGTWVRLPSKSVPYAE